jgi:hypothetical protein
MDISQMVAAKTNQWANEAELFFARCGKAGQAMHREFWANGEIMVGPVGARCNQMIPLARAFEIFRAGWKIVR